MSKGMLSETFHKKLQECREQKEQLQEKTREKLMEVNRLRKAVQDAELQMEQAVYTDERIKEELENLHIHYTGSTNNSKLTG